MSVEHDEIIAARAMELIDRRWHWRMRVIDLLTGGIIGALLAIGLHEALI